MGLFATLNPEQLGRVQRAKAAQSPFDIGACLNAAMAALKRDFLNIALSHFVMGLVMALVIGIGMIPFLGLIAMILLFPPLIIGFARFNLKAIRGQKAEMGDMFSGFDSLGQGALMYLVMLVCVLLGTLCLILPGIYLAIAWSFSWMILSQKQGTFWECMEISRQVVTPSWGWVLLLLFVSAIVSYLGIFACVIGIFATAPLYGLMHAVAYDRLFPAENAAEAVVQA